MVNSEGQTCLKEMETDFPGEITSDKGLSLARAVESQVPIFLESRCLLGGCEVYLSPCVRQESERQGPCAGMLGSRSTAAGKLGEMLSVLLVMCCQ